AAAAFTSSSITTMRPLVFMALRASARGLGRLERQRDREGRALAGLARRLDLAAVGVHDLLRDRQPQAGALGLGRDEQLEDVDALGQPWTVVAHLDDRAAVAQPALERDRAAVRH